MIGGNRIQQTLEGVLRWANRKTLYPLVLGDWSNVRIPENLQMIINTGYFKSHLKPFSPNLNGIKNVLVIAPHQDDEAIGCGGLLFKLKDQANIDVVFITNGAQDNMGFSIEESIQLRKLEATSALKLCNANPIFLGIPNNKFEILEKYVLLLENVLKEKNPDLILAPWLFDRPWKHRLTNLLLFDAIIRLPQYRNIPIWSYQVHNMLFPNIVIDITDEIAKKNEMICIYKSQIENGTPYNHYITGMNQWNSQYLDRNKNGFAEIYFGLPIEDWIVFFEKFIKPNSESYINFS